MSRVCGGQQAPDRRDVAQIAIDQLDLAAEMLDVFGPVRQRAEPNTRAPWPSAYSAM